MITSHILSSMFNKAQGRGADSLSLTPGQIVAGKILKNLTQQSAIVQLNSFRVRAQLQTPLAEGQKAWLQVQSVSNPITLKVISFADGLSPVQNKQIQQLLAHLGNSEETVRSIQMTRSKGWPMTPEVVRAVRSFLFGAPLHQQLTQLYSLLTDEQRAHISIPSVFIVDHHRGQSEPIRSFLHMLGLHHEHHLFRTLGTSFNPPFIEQDQRQQTLKYQLQQLIQQAHISVQAKEKAERIITLITGQQLFVSLENQPSSVYQLLFQLPLQMDNEMKTLYGQIEGRKTKKGDIDPDNCRLVFYIQFHALGEIMVDVKINNKIVSLSIASKEPRNDWLSVITPSLGQGLQKAGYTLSSLQWNQSVDMNRERTGANQIIGRFPVQIQGVDIRV